MTSDADLLRRYLHDRDDTAFAAIVRKHGPMVLATCHRTARRRADAEDAFQATFLVLASRAEAIRTPERLGAWLHGVAVRCARKARDVARRSTTIPPDSFDSLPAVSLPSPEPDLSAVIDDALAAIPDTYRAAVVLCHLEGRTRAEAARELGWSEGTLSGRLHRALKLLGERLSARGVTAAGAVVLAVLSARTATATVPVSLVASTCSAAGLVSAGFGEPGAAHSLARGVLRAMTFRKLKLAALGLGLFGLGTFALFGRLDAKPTDPPVRMHIKAPVPADKGTKERWKKVVEVEHKAAVSVVAVNDELLATAGGDTKLDCDLRLWDSTTGKKHPLEVRGPVFTSPASSLRFVSGGKYLMMTASGGGVIRYEQRNGGLVGDCIDAVYTLGFADDLSAVVLRDARQPNNKLGMHSNLWEVPNATVKADCTIEYPAHKGVTHATCASDGKRLVVANAESVIRTYGYDGNGLKEGQTIELPAKTPLTALKLSDDGKRLAAVGEKGFAKVYDADTGKELCELAGHDGTVRGVVFTADGKQLATACGKTVRVFDAKSGKKVSEFEAHTDDVTCLAFTQDGKRLVTGSKDKSAKVWERDGER